MKVFLYYVFIYNYSAISIIWTNMLSASGVLRLSKSFFTGSVQENYRPFRTLSTLSSVLHLCLYWANFVSIFISYNSCAVFLLIIPVFWPPIWSLLIVAFISLRLHGGVLLAKYPVHFNFLAIISLDIDFWYFHLPSNFVYIYLILLFSPVRTIGIFGLICSI